MASNTFSQCTILLDWMEIASEKEQICEYLTKCLKVYSNIFKITLLIVRRIFRNPYNMALFEFYKKI